MNAVPPALEVDRIGVRLGGVEVLRGATLGVAAGEVVAVAGPNGAGKTTLLRAVSRAVRLAAGEIRVAGQALASLSPRELARRVAVVPQDAALVFPFRASELVLMGRAPHAGRFGFDSRADVELARAAMARVGIEHLADRSVLELSGGERQLVLFARALAQEAQLLLLDEPTAHLDLSHRLCVLEQARAFADAGGSVLFVSHDLGLAARSCDRVVLLHGGVVVAEGVPGEVFTPERLRRVFGVRAELLRAADGAPVVVARAPEPRPGAQAASLRRLED
ncbi:MAG: ABC transporter ATP-binding protein [Myxococcota bacterium]|nr:ABC transporter ATP-binding protein [Myxococcota bacterium]